MRKDEEEALLVITGILLSVLVIVVVAASGALFMLVAGIVNGYWSSFPAFSFLESTVIVVVLTILGRLIRGGKS